MYLTLKCRQRWLVLDVFRPRWELSPPLKVSAHLMFGRNGEFSQGRIGIEVGTGTHCNPHGAWYPGASSPRREHLRDVS